MTALPAPRFFEELQAVEARLRAALIDRERPACRWLLDVDGRPYAHWMVGAPAASAALVNT